MPTARPRYQVTETAAVARAIDIAARRWPGESRCRLLLRLVEAGSLSLASEHSEEDRSRREAVAATSGKYGDAVDDRYLDDLRADWPE